MWSRILKSVGIWARVAIKKGGSALFSAAAADSIMGAFREAYESGDFEQTLKAHALGYVVAYASQEYDLELDEENPLSKESLTAALSNRTGVPITNLFDKDALKRDLIAHGMRLGAAKVAERTGLELSPDDPFSKQSVTLALSSRTGIELRDLFDRQVLQDDVVRYALRRGAADIAQRTGLYLDPSDPFTPQSLTQAVSGLAGVPLTNLFDRAQLQEDLLSWSEVQIMQRVANHVTDFTSRASGVTRTVSVAAWVSKVRKAAGNMRAGQVRSAITGIYDTVGPIAHPAKVERRRATNRAAQQRFRERHGRRDQYVPVGFAVAVAPGAKVA